MLDIEEFVTRRFDDYSYYGSPPSDIRVNCPMCPTHDYKQHLYISLDKHVTHCFRCGYSANWVKFVMDVTGLPYFKAIGELYAPGRMKDDLKAEIESSWEDADRDKIARDYKLPDDFVLLKDVHDGARLSTEAKQYLISRGFDRPYWIKYRLGISEELGYRIIIPIEYGYWQGRAMYKWVQPKYINPDVPSREVIFNSAALESYPEVVICEGAFSAMAVGANAIALISKEAPKEKLERLIDSKAQSFIIALEPGAFPSMGKMADALHRAGKKLTIWRYSKGDPADPAGEFEVLDYGLRSKLLLSMAN